MSRLRNWLLRGYYTKARTFSQYPLLWHFHQFVPGTRRPERIDENAKAADIRLNDEMLNRINELARPGLAEGATLV